MEYLHYDASVFKRHLTHIGRYETTKPANKRKYTEKKYGNQLQYVNGIILSEL